MPSVWMAAFLSQKEKLHCQLIEANPQKIHAHTLNFTFSILRFLLLTLANSIAVDGDSHPALFEDCTVSLVVSRSSSSLVAVDPLAGHEGSLPQTLCDNTKSPQKENPTRKSRKT